MNKRVVMRALLSENTMWETFGWRPLTASVYGGADFGEITSTIAAVGDSGTRATSCYHGVSETT